MHYKIPQNLDIEDKIVGPLTMRGLIIAAVGGGISYWSYMKLDDDTWPVIVVPVTLITVAVIFVKIQNMTFLEWLSALMLLLLKPQKRIWQKLSDSPEMKVDPNEIQIEIKKAKKQETIEEIQSNKLDKLEQLRKQGLLR